MRLRVKGTKFRSVIGLYWGSFILQNLILPCTSIPNSSVSPAVTAFSYTNTRHLVPYLVSLNSIFLYKLLITLPISYFGSGIWGGYYTPSTFVKFGVGSILCAVQRILFNSYWDWWEVLRMVDVYTVWDIPTPSSLIA